MAMTLPPDTLAAHPEWSHMLNGSAGPTYAPPPPQGGSSDDMWQTMMQNPFPAAPPPTTPSWLQGESTSGWVQPNGQRVPMYNTLPGTPSLYPNQAAPSTPSAPSYPPSAVPGAAGAYPLNLQNGTNPYFPPSSTGYSGPGTPQSDYGLPSVAQFDQFGYPNPAVTEWNARRGLQGAQNTRNLAEQNYYNMQEQRLQPAEATVLSARSTQLAAQSSYLSEQGRQLAQSQQEQADVQAAQNNTSDLQNVARGQREQESQTYRYRLAGLNAPIEVTMPPGYSGPMPIGTVAKIQTLASQLETIYKNADDVEKFRVEAARIHSEQTGQDVTAADIARGSVQLSLEEAQLAVSRAGLQETQASQGVQNASLPPAPGLQPYTNPDDGTFQWVTPGQLSELQRVDARNRSLRTAAEFGTSGFNIGQLETYASELNTDGTPVMTEDEITSILQQRGTSPADIQTFIDRVHYLQQQKRNNPFGSFGSTTGGAGAPGANSLPGYTAP